MTGFMTRPSRRGRLMNILLAIAIGVVVVLLVAIGLGYLRLPAPDGPKVTITEVRWTILQGTNAYNQGWFGKGQFNYTRADGWLSPTYSSGSRFLLTWEMVNYDTVNHTIFDVALSAPFIFIGTQPPLPVNVIPGDEAGTLGVLIETSSSTSGSFALNVTVNALGGSSG